MVTHILCDDLGKMPKTHPDGACLIFNSDCLIFYFLVELGKMPKTSWRGLPNFYFFVILGKMPKTHPDGACIIFNSDCLIFYFLVELGKMPKTSWRGLPNFYFFCDDLGKMPKTHPDGACLIFNSVIVWDSSKNYFDQFFGHIYCVMIWGRWQKDILMGPA